MTFGRLAIIFASTASVAVLAQAPEAAGLDKLEAETMQHYQAVLRLDTRNPPGNEVVVAEYVKGVLDKEGIPATIVGSDPKRPNVIARLKGNGRKKPLLIMGHSDTVTTDEKKWTHPPLSATRDGGYVYGRGTVDDKDNLTAALMTMLLLKRLNVPLDRDVIFVSEAGEEGRLQRRHRLPGEGSFPADRGGVLPRRRRRRHAHRRRGEVRRRCRRWRRSRAASSWSRTASPATDRCRSSRTPSCTSPARSPRSATGGPTIRFNETTGSYFRKLAAISPPDVAKYYRDVLSTDPKVQKAADDWLLENEPRHSSMLRTSVSPNIFAGGYRSNVIPSEAKATLDVRALPDEDPAKFLEQVKQVVNDPAVDVRFTGESMRPAGPDAQARLGGLTRRSRPPARASTTRRRCR